MFEALAWRVSDVNYGRRCIIRLREQYSWLYSRWRKSRRNSDAMRGSRSNWKLGQRVVI
jgi:hypothetical protein